MRRLYKIGILLLVFQLTLVFNYETTIGNEIIKAPTPVSSKYFYNFQSQLPEFTRFEERFDRFMAFWNVKGAAVAIAKDGKLIYTKGFGYANIENNEKVEPYHKFRVASVSKLITATAIMKLVEEGKLSLDDKVFGQTGILNMDPYLNYRDKKVEDITVRHLLEHSGGWTVRYGDPLFEQHSLARRHGYKEPLSSEDLIAIMLSKRLQFRPGHASYYSNLGFVILGKVIEKASGINYELYVQSKILQPLGIYDMQLGNNLRNDKHAAEVNYYEQPNAIQIMACNGSGSLAPKSNGGNNLLALEAAGAWVGSATDIMKLLLALDGFPYPADILSEESIKEMTTPKATGYAPLGWRSTNRYGHWIRTGSMAGTSAVIKRRPDGVSFVILCNTSAWIGPDYPFKLASFADREINRVKMLPEHDLFEEQQKLYLSFK